MKTRNKLLSMLMAFIMVLGTIMGAFIPIVPVMAASPEKIPPGEVNISLVKAGECLVLIDTDVTNHE